MSRPEWQEIVMRLEAACSEVGLDLVHAFDVANYNSAADAADRLHDFGRSHGLGVVIGHTRELWPRFVRAVESDSALAACENPLDSYVMTQLTQIVGQVTTRASQLLFSHQTEPRAFPIQRLAELVGFAALGPSYLTIHPLHGPWLGLRAVVVVDVAGPDTAPPELTRPCRGCSAPCVPALQRAILASGTPLTSSAVTAHAAEWIAVRDACPVGRSSRYSDAQLAYHYAPARSRIHLGRPKPR